MRGEENAERGEGFEGEAEVVVEKKLESLKRRGCFEVRRVCPHCGGRKTARYARKGNVLYCKCQAKGCGKRFKCVIFWRDEVEGVAVE